MSSCPVVIDRTGQDIHAEGARIRAQGPVARIELPGGVPAWSVTDYAIARQVMADPRFSRDPRKHWRAYVEGEIGMDFPLIGWVLMQNITTTHGEDHNRLRSLTVKAFSPRRVGMMRASVERIAGQLLDDLATVPAGEPVDLKARFARELPSRVICDLFGIPDHLRDALQKGGDVNVDTTISAEESAANVAEWHREMLRFIEAKRNSPDRADDMTADLLDAQENGSRLTETELVDTLHLLLATGTEPVMNLVTNAVLALLTHPEQLALVKSGEISWRDVIEETLRAEAPVAHLPFRFPLEDVELGGVTVPKGDPILINYAAVGRDPAVHGDSAADFDVTRAGKDKHLSFGHGAHRCLGTTLGLLEAEIALSGLFERFPELSLSGTREEIEPQGTFIMNGIRALPVRLTAPVPAGAR
ncbi:cytochrome P450 family protein [Streptomyces sp. Da 82-17]|uniref:cytochrome P450 family protein n=1 Tax=Streptomyces sp. Da 82-17 TaxID=3377116 RepID=UPI0038D4A495